ncbi:hypothetical protein TVAG_440460 [Trichomonas vaginalis G3]|uniref:Uncharacterized protein n=1 Tax=Trichomonas vaginalis (strain ATCC PRA-98 / G3) TaxID=412133 RepID=A2F1K2_TRIV3|nr:glycoprotein 38 family [Trichomonas vaginalis G3]EAY01220.1 hypothetical protein TVAG_440460 [Trichomonas vaginalis G3]KAI5532500.1 glycoprotein 38 family [Trichomonas vaginalis G3]|eukprot:XP_001330136.1 hypothetical protein [Trichomonas vaginalis G3]
MAQSGDFPSIYALKPWTAFEESECDSYYIAPDYSYGLKYNYKTIVIPKGKNACVEGSFILASKSNYKVISKIPENSSKGYTWKKIEYDNALAALGAVDFKVDDDSIVGYHLIYRKPVTKIIPNDQNSETKVQILGVNPSYYIDLTLNVLDSKYHFKLGYKTEVSSKPEDSFNVYINWKINDASQKGGDIEEVIVNGIAFYNKEREFSYERSKYAGFTSSLEWKDQTAMEGIIGKAKTAIFYAWLNLKELGTDPPSKPKSEYNLDNKISFKLTSSASADDEEEETEFFFPEFHASLSTEGGVFDKDNIDQKFPGDKSKFPVWAIVVIVIVVILVVAAIVGVCVYFFVIKPKKVGASPSDGGNEQKEPNN